MGVLTLVSTRKEECDGIIMTSRIETLCEERSILLTEQRRIVARVLSESNDHPSVKEVYSRASAIDSSLSIATVYRTLRLFEEAGILERHAFDGRESRYEEASRDHHDHLIDIDTGVVVEFQNEEIENLQEEIATRLGFKLVGHRLELYGRKIK